MELQLRLGLPSNYNATKGLDLNSCEVCETKQVVGSGINRDVLQLGQGPFPLLDSSENTSNSDASHGKPCCVDAFGDTRDVPRTLPLLIWDKQPNEEKDDPTRDVIKIDSFVLNKVDGEDIGTVGWPPIKLIREKISHHYRKINRTKVQRKVENGCVDCQGRLPNSKYVKVNVEGAVIGRKIDLSVYYSLQTLKLALLALFGICKKNSGRYKLTYQDMEGEWLPADSVSWGRFIGSVQRLKLAKTEE